MNVAAFSLPTIPPDAVESVRKAATLNIVWKRVPDGRRCRLLSRYLLGRGWQAEQAALAVVLYRHHHGKGPLAVALRDAAGLVGEEAVKVQAVPPAEHREREHRCRLAEHIGQRVTYTANVARFGKRPRLNRMERTVMFIDVADDTGIVADHLWLSVGHRLERLNLHVGDRVQFTARVKTYCRENGTTSFGLIYPGDVVTC